MGEGLNPKTFPLATPLLDAISKSMWAHKILL